MLNLEGRPRTPLDTCQSVVNFSFWIFSTHSSFSLSGLLFCCQISTFHDTQVHFSSPPQPTNPPQSPTFSILVFVPHHTHSSLVFQLPYPFNPGALSWTDFPHAIFPSRTVYHYFPILLFPTPPQGNETPQQKSFFPTVVVIGEWSFFLSGDPLSR